MEAKPLTAPLVSIIIPCYNYEAYINQAIESVLNQDYSNIELIVVDDCSTDRSREIIRSYGERLTPVFHEVNQGHGGAFNNGYANANGDIIMFLDADDYLQPNTLKEAIKNISEHQGMCQFRMELVDKSGNAYDIHPKLELKFDESDTALNQLCTRGKYQSTVTSGLMFHRSYLSQVMPMPLESFRQGADGYLVTLAPLYTNVSSSSLILSSYRQHGGNHSGFSKELTKRATWRIEHNVKRYIALEAAAKHQNCTLAEQFWKNDVSHLCELMCLRLFNQPIEESKYTVSSSRYEIMSKAIKGLKLTNLSRINQTILSLWWLFIATLPTSIAKPIFSWNVLASSRPAFIKSVSRILRRV